MKKYILILILIMSFCSGGYGQEVYDPVMTDDPLDVIFQSSVVDTVHDYNERPYTYDDEKGYKPIDPANMPFIKQIRLRLSNKYLDVSTRSERAEANEHTYVQKWKFWDKNRGKFIPKVQPQEAQEEDTGELTEAIAEETATEISDLSFESGINTEVTEKQLVLDSDNVNFDEVTGDMIATGRPVLNLPPQNTVVIADKMTYNDDGNILKGIGNVYVNRDGKPVTGDYLEIDMNEESMYMDNVLAKAENMNLTAENVVQKEGMLIFTKGNLNSESSTINRIKSKTIGPNFEDMIIDPDAQALFFGNPEGNNLTIHIDEIEVDARKNHDVFKAKNIKFYRKDKYFFKWPSITIYTNKQHDYFEGNYPELGSRRKLGLFLGPGFAFSGPFGSVVKVVPFVNYKKEFGFGGMLKYVNTNNYTELGYGSANEMFFLRGKQRLDDHLYLQYAANSYTNEWFLGSRMAKYMAEVYYDRAYLKKDFLAKDLPLVFRHRIGFGLMEDDDRNYNGEKFSHATGMSTTRTRYMAQISQTLFKFEDEERRMKLEAAFLMQGSAALYGTGDTQFIGRVGPIIRSQYKNWVQDVVYYIAGFDDKTPMPRYDAYRYGAQSIRITEGFRVNKYLSVGWMGYINLSDDAPNKKMFQENAFLVSLGPDDFKIVLGYDFIRQRTYFGFNVAFDPRGTNINYEKMVIKNPERLGNQDSEIEDYEQQVAFAPSKVKATDDDGSFYRKTPKHRVLEYAQVIEIEDPDREKID